MPAIRLLWTPQPELGLAILVLLALLAIPRLLRSKRDKRIHQGRNYVSLR